MKYPNSPVGHTLVQFHPIDTSDRMRDDVSLGVQTGARP